MHFKVDGIFSPRDGASEGLKLFGKFLAAARKILHVRVKKFHVIHEDRGGTCFLRWKTCEEECVTGLDEVGFDLGVVLARVGDKDKDRTCQAVAIKRPGVVFATDAESDTMYARVDAVGKTR